MDVANRAEKEAELAGVLAALLMGQRSRLLAEIGPEPDVEALPDSFWTELEALAREALSAKLLAIYLLQASTLALSVAVDSRARLTTAAARYAIYRGGTVASAYVSRARDRIETMIRGGSTADEIRSASLEIFGPSVADRIAATETTAAASAGEIETIDAGGGTDVETLWRTEPGACPICRPLNGKPREVWEAEFPKGPPAHPNCRCWLDHFSKSGLVGL